MQIQRSAKSGSGSEKRIGGELAVIEGVVTIVQESRFQLVDDRGVAHLLILDPNATAEPDQLVALAGLQARVKVKTKAGHGVIGRIATSLETM